MDVSLVGILLGVVLTFGGMFLASRVLNFDATAAQLAVIAPVASLTGMIPTFGWAISIASMYIMLKQISKQDSALLMIIVSWVMSVLIIIAVAKII